MKNKEKYIFLSLFIIAVLCLIGIVSVFHKHKLEQYYPKTDTLVYDMSKQEIEKEIGLQEKWYTSYHVLHSLLLTEYERIVMIGYKEEYKDEIIKQCHMYINALKKQYSDIGVYQEYINDSYYFLIISKEADTIMKEIKKNLL